MRKLSGKLLHELSRDLLAHGHGLNGHDVHGVHDVHDVHDVQGFHDGHGVHDVHGFHDVQRVHDVHDDVHDIHDDDDEDDLHADRCGVHAHGGHIRDVEHHDGYALDDAGVVHRLEGNSFDLLFQPHQQQCLLPSQQQSH